MASVTIVFLVVALILGTKLAEAGVDWRTAALVGVGLGSLRATLLMVYGV